MLHRYQVEAATKLVGGMDYVFALRGDGQQATRIVAPEEQRRALAAVLATLKGEVLALPEPLLKMIPPRPPEYPRGREHFKIYTSPAFDALAPAEAAAQHTLQFLFNPERAARLVEFHARDAANPALEEVIDAVLDATWKTPHGNGYPAEIARAVSDVALYDLAALAANEHAQTAARAMASLKLDELRKWLETNPGDPSDSVEHAHRFFASQEIQRFQRDPKAFALPAPAEPPDGPPIGDQDPFGASFGDPFGEQNR
jgi:hypothetical protein